jgi:hypothetical protein
VIDGRRTRLVLVAISCGLAASALYWETLAARFVWDDHVLIERNPELEHWSGLWRGFTDVSGTLRGAAYYPPISMASYFTDRQAWGFDAAGFHLTNVALHGVVTGRLHPSRARAPRLLEARNARASGRAPSRALAGLPVLST